MSKNNLIFKRRCTIKNVVAPLQEFPIYYPKLYRNTNGLHDLTSKTAEH
jgi:hypothetical protein